MSNFSSMCAQAVYLLALFLRLDVCMDEFLAAAAAADEDTRKIEELFSSSSCNELLP
jgi:hypothetical protein